MNRVIVQYWFYLFVFFLSFCILGVISIKKFKNRKNEKVKPIFANKIWFKVLKIFIDYGLTVLVAIAFLQFALDIPFAILQKYSVTEGTITHVYKGEITMGDYNYTVVTTGLSEGDKVKVYYLPFSKNAPIVEKID